MFFIWLVWRSGKLRSARLVVG